MKDISHHMTKFIKNNSKKETPEDTKVLNEYEKEHPLHQQKKQQKAILRKEGKERVPETQSPKERNKKMKRRIPKHTGQAH
jgi:hypothetical protein